MHVYLFAIPPPPPIQYLLFEYPPDINDVRVKITSNDDTRDICAIASIQNVYVSVWSTLEHAAFQAHMILKPIP